MTHTSLRLAKPSDRASSQQLDWKETDMHKGHEPYLAAVIARLDNDWPNCPARAAPMWRQPLHALRLVREGLAVHRSRRCSRFLCTLLCCPACLHKGGYSAKELFM